MFYFLIAIAVAQVEGMKMETETYNGKTIEVEVVELNDSNFEHLTQASTGATTGDWFIMFYKPNCAACAVLESEWAALSDQVSRASDLQVTIAKINLENSPDLLKRFNLNTSPTLLYFRLGMLYKISELSDSKSLFKLVEEHKYKDYPSQPVPKPLGIFDKLWRQFTGFL